MDLHGIFGEPDRKWEQFMRGRLELEAKDFETRSREAAHLRERGQTSRPLHRGRSPASLLKAQPSGAKKSSEKLTECGYPRSVRRHAVTTGRGCTDKTGVVEAEANQGTTVSDGRGCETNLPLLHREKIRSGEGRRTTYW